MRNRLARRSSLSTPSLQELPNFAIVIRGDIISSTGYARAARALAAILSRKYPVYGVSIFEDEMDNHQTFPGTLISEGDVQDLARTMRIAVIHHTTPDAFAVIPYTISIGVFYWETESIPRDLDWVEKIASMQAIWAPTTFISEIVSKSGYHGPVHIVPWPHTFGRSTFRLSMGELGSREVTYIERMPSVDEASWARISLRNLRSIAAHLFLGVQSLAPRKGLPVLLAEWREFAASADGCDAVLLLKISFRHAQGVGRDPHLYLMKFLQRLGFVAGDRLRLAILNDNLSDDEMSALFDMADAFVSASFGEGFGGPIVEALGRGIPVIAPRHTGIRDLLPPEYPLTIPYSENSIGLRDNPEVYPPCAIWCVPHPHAIARLLRSFTELALPERKAIARIGARHAARFCDSAVIERILLRNGLPGIQ